MAASTLKRQDAAVRPLDGRPAALTLAPRPLSLAPSPVKRPSPASDSRSWKRLWALFSVACLLCLACLTTLHNAVAHTTAANRYTSSGLLAPWRSPRVLAKLQQLSHMFTAVDASTVKRRETQLQLAQLGDYECLAWRQTTNCTPQGDPEAHNDRNCSSVVPSGVSGYCEVRHRSTGDVARVLSMHCASLRPGVHFTCGMFQSLLAYSILSTDYEHDANFSYARNQQRFRAANALPVAASPLSGDEPTAAALSFERGIVLVVYEKLLLGAYVSVRSLRAMGCTLPIEMWYDPRETDVGHPLVQLLVRELHVGLRVLDDPRATTFYTKLYAVFYSAFDQVLLLDADNFAVRDPTYLFDAPEFVHTGAMFWPDYWRPGNTIFNIQETSFVWEFFGLTYTDAFEQESGQVLIDRRRHYKALNVLMYYGFSLPRAFEDLRLVWGDKDLFRFAWLKTKSPFYMSPRPPGAAGTKHPDYDLFCGVTMVQYDAAGRVLFLHRNTEKLTDANNRILWTHVQQFKRSLPVSEYYVRGANGGKVFPQFKRCFGKDVHYEKLFTLKPLSAFSFEHLEDDLLRYTAAGAEVLRLAGYHNETISEGAD
ncbi:unnamed protein product [Hyaloperonospora brassicae]|uniref:Nucleotide-diphospho-sugar transferase n=1 Tax=Hyaloperonospora brassicae TaxID=162125 RepID=A0AAV0U6Q4_HYABA|nr:unnamed protein product [Hyaloperonospora brassicae]